MRRVEAVGYCGRSDDFGTVFRQRFCLELFAASMTMKLLPQNAANVSDSKSGDSPENTRRDNDPEEIPQPTDERPARELIREKTPRERCRADETSQESDVGREILDGRAPELVELRKNCSPLDGL